MNAFLGQVPLAQGPESGFGQWPRFERREDPSVVVTDWPSEVARTFPSDVTQGFPSGQPVGSLGAVQVAPATSPWSSALHAPPGGGRRAAMG